jgi:hypothetical protein
MFIILAKAGTSLLLSAGLMILVRNQLAVESYFTQKRIPWLLIFWAIFRLVPFVIIYLLFSFTPKSDVEFYYYPIGLAAKTLKVMYRDVYCPYGPLFGYWMSIPLFFWNNSKVLILHLTLIELLAVWLTYRFYEEKQTRGERLFRSLFYMMLPVPFVFTIMSGQEDVWLWLFALLALQVMVRKQSDYLCGLVLALGLLSTKAVFILVVIPFLLLTRRPVAFIAGLATLGLPTLVYLYLETGFLFLEQPLEEGSYLKAPNWASLLHPWTSTFINPSLSVWNYVGLLISLVVGILIIQKVRSRDYSKYFPLFFIATFSVMTVVQKNAVANYAYLFMLPLVFRFVNFHNRQEVFWLILFNVIAAVHPSFWWRIGQPYYETVGDIFAKPVFMLEYAMEMYLIGYLLHVSLKARKELRDKSYIHAQSLAQA